MIDEEKHASEVLDLLHHKIEENTSIKDEKTKQIIDSVNAYYGNRAQSENVGDKLSMLDDINYAKSLLNIANRQLSRYLLMLDRPYFGRLDFKNEWGELPYYCQKFSFFHQD